MIRKNLFDGVLGGHISEFLAWPIIAGHHLHMGAFFTILSATVFLMILMRSFWICLRTKGAPVLRLIQGITGFKPINNTDLVITIAFLWFGIIFTASPFICCRHHLLVAFPLQGLWLARLALFPTEGEDCNRNISRFLLGTICFCFLGISTLFLSYIHVYHGAPIGDYGVAYSAQNSIHSDGEKRIYP